MGKILILLILFSPLSYAQNNGIDFVSFTIENDIIFSEDGGYSNGFIGSWGYKDLTELDNTNLPNWLAYLADKSYLTSMPDKTYAISYSVGQFIQTATDITLSELVEEDAPYAGLLAWEGQINAFDQDVSDELGLILGVVGPASGAEQLQKAIHSLTDSDTPNGWGHQLDNELVFRVQAKRTWRLFDLALPLKETEFDIIGGVSGGVGNLRSDLGTGLNFRWGQQLSKSFASASAMPIEKFSTLNNTSDGWYVFANISASYVANDIFMDGNTFKDSHSVELIHDQYAFSTGAILNISNWSFLVSMVRISDEYETQTEPTRFGSFTVSYNY
ncbi:MAG: lipid A deacylase LpxR family protein [Psychromonas sp.]